MQVFQILNILEELAPPHYQESYDNSGLIVGSYTEMVSSILISIDVTEEVIDEAIKLGANLIISHHPIIFKGLKRINGNNMVEKCVLKAIKNDIAIYSIHTNLDNVENGVNKRICDIIGLENTQILAPLSNQLSKIIVFTPIDYAQQVKEAIFENGAGIMGKYDNCSFNTQGVGTFKGLDGANPFVGKKGEIHLENELKIETIVPNYLINKVIDAVTKVHPYEEVAYDIYELKNKNITIGAGMIGELAEEKNTIEFLEYIKEKFQTACIKYSPITKNKVKKVAVCGGSGSFLIPKAIKNHADIFITGDVKYHDYFIAENKIIIADIGHYESEQYTKNIIYDLLIKKISKFAIHLSKVKTNPVNYL